MATQKTVKKSTLEQMSALIKKRDDLFKKIDDARRRSTRYDFISSYSLYEILDTDIAYTGAELMSTLTKNLETLTTNPENGNPVVYRLNSDDYGCDTIYKYEVVELDVSSDIAKLEAQIADINNQIAKLERTLLDSLKAKYE